MNIDEPEADGQVQAVLVGVRVLIIVLPRFGLSFPHFLLLAFADFSAKGIHRSLF